MKLLIFKLIIFSVLSIPFTGLAETSTQSHGHEHSGEGHGEKGQHDDLMGDRHAAPHVDNDAQNHDAHSHDEKPGAHGQSAHDGHDEHETSGVSLSREKMQLGDITVTRLEQQTIQQEITIPGEVKANRYATSISSPRIAAQIIKRHTRLGDVVKAGHPLVTLSSVEMAQAQGDLIIKNREWLRVKKLGRKVVSEKRYIEAQIAQQQAHAKVVAYGMTEKQARQLLVKGDIAGATGRFDLLAAQDGTVVKDEFIIGEIVAPGRVLFEITDEKNLWVEARARPEVAYQIVNNTRAKIKLQHAWVEGRVIQVQHVVDEGTRTLPVRLEVEDKKHQLHPGQFVEVQLQLTPRSAVMAVPKAAALRNAEGEWVVFVENEPGNYRSVDITPIKTVGDRLIVEGLTPGLRVVTKGAFFLQSELAKSGFDVHNH